jgi:hypothetical protein
MRRIWNYISLQLGWFACVGGAARGLAWAGPSAAVVLVALHLAFSDDRARESRRLAVVGIMGLLLETGALSAGLYAYSAGGPVKWLAPAWIVALWVLLGTTFESSLSWLAGRPVLAAAFGAIGSPLSFSAGVKLGAARFLVPPSLGLCALAALWAAAFPLAMAVSHAIVKEER